MLQVHGGYSFLLRCISGAPTGFHVISAWQMVSQNVTFKKLFGAYMSFIQGPAGRDWSFSPTMWLCLLSFLFWNLLYCWNFDTFEFWNLSHLPAWLALLDKIHTLICNQECSWWRVVWSLPETRGGLSKTTYNLIKKVVNQECSW